MIEIRTVVSKLNAMALGSAKIPHGISNPVLRIEEGEVYIAAFVYVYKRENLQQKTMPRPIHWILADMETGDIVNEFDCRQKDFSAAGFGDLYDLNDSGVKKPTREDFAEIYSLFDSVRSEYLNTGRINADRYIEYFNRIMEVTPGSYRKFYCELSNFCEGGSCS